MGVMEKKAGKRWSADDFAFIVFGISLAFFLCCLGVAALALTVKVMVA